MDVLYLVDATYRIRPRKTVRKDGWNSLPYSHSKLARVVHRPGLLQITSWPEVIPKLDLNLLLCLVPVKSSDVAAVWVCSSEPSYSQLTDELGKRAWASFERLGKSMPKISNVGVSSLNPPTARVELT